MRGDYWEIACPACGDARVGGAAKRLEIIQQAGMLRREKKPDEAMLDELFTIAVSRMACLQCGALGLTAGQAVDDFDDEDSGLVQRLCASCSKPIPSERLEVFPDAQQCAGCKEKGAPPAGPLTEEDFCERCGARMVLYQSRSGLHRFSMVCSDGCR
ncbi:TraR/DksA C4-type zinc finger protein [Lignipirellula cremea]|uniref:Zinc finger DksA/TraR C4-type domain-containing protein n=1 Tax=Lignipirellula cremea TaxID=2528010 RepID=A0A518DRG6_9BACT|nr:TraR/DksA C4-type zinc finger protein [Lignipirellula cremea]QDU94440.1 hypothetical protein Pla8534_22300 [Lignipirellula cremea]